MSPTAIQFDSALRSRIQNHLRLLEVRAAPAGRHRAAAVAVAITEEGWGADVAGVPKPANWSKQAALILTRRALSLGRHAGQWALPGGRVDAGETPEQAALRELFEEIGLQLDSNDILGRLDDYVTHSGFVMTPVVVWAGAAPALLADPGEVASIHRIPVSEFMRKDAPMLEVLRDSAHPALRMPVGDHWIAAPTAAVLYQFRELCIAGLPTRVAHFEQPLFARK
ncbi:MAG: CoA pyrophosphatase [Burkholderiaceae bacterium]